MKKLITILFLTFTSIICFSQVEFIKGYFITNNNEKVDCYIMYKEWITNPKTLTFKMHNKDKKQIKTIDEVKEFYIQNKVRFIRATVNIDQSSDITDNLTYEPQPIWKSETVFLQVLVSGNYNLYYYGNTSYNRYFYSVDSNTITQLIYRRYFSHEKIQYTEAEKHHEQLLKNHKENVPMYYDFYGKFVKVKGFTDNSFRLQLMESTNCMNNDTSYFKKIQYNGTDLINYFKEINMCMLSPYTIEYIAIESDSLNSFNNRIYFGLGNSFIGYRNYNGNMSKYPNQYFPDIKIEAEFLIASTSNKLGILIQPTFHHFHAVQTFLWKDSESIDYNRIVFPVGLRYYFYLPRNYQIFLTPMIFTGITANIKSSFYIEYNPSFVYQIGINKERFSLLFTRYAFKFQLPETYYYRNNSISLGFKF